MTGTLGNRRNVLGGCLDSRPSELSLIVPGRAVSRRRVRHGTGTVRNRVTRRRARS